MKKLCFVQTLGLATLLVAAGPSHAHTFTSNLAVSARVVPNCSIAPGSLGFSGYDPVGANASAPLTGASTLSLDCTQGAPATVTLGQGIHAAPGSTNAAPLRRLSNGGANPAYLSYALYQDSGFSTSWANSLSGGVAYTGQGRAGALTVYGKVDAGQNVPPDSYSDTVTVTISF